MLRGSCLCGAVRYEIEGALGPITCCHCSMCRKAQGTAFATNAPVDAHRFRITQGVGSLRAFRSSPEKERVFCGTCGSPLYSRHDARPEVVRVRIGTLDSPISARPSAHIFVASKAEWWTIRDDVPQHAALEPDRTVAAAPSRDSVRPDPSAKSC